MFYDWDLGDLYVFDQYTNYWTPTVNVGFRKHKNHDRNIKINSNSINFSEKHFITCMNRMYSTHYAIYNLNYS